MFGCAFFVYIVINLKIQTLFLIPALAQVDKVVNLVELNIIPFLHLIYHWNHQLTSKIPQNFQHPNFIFFYELIISV